MAVHFSLRLFLTPFPLWPAVLLGYTLVMAGVALASAWLLAGWPAVRWLAPPLILLASAIPLPSAFEAGVTRPLRELFASITAEICNLVGLPAIAYGTTVGLASTAVGIDEACGGIRSLQACFMIGLFFGEWYRFGLRRRAALILAGIGAALLGNFGRVVFLAMRAGAGSRAVESVHDSAGWVAMLASLVLTGWLAWRWGGYRGPAVQGAAERRPCAINTGWRWLVAVASIFVVDETAVRSWYGEAQAVRSKRPQWTAQFPTQLGTFQESTLAEPAREMLRPDLYVAGQWRTTRDFTVAAYYIEWRRGQVARYIPFLHNPTVCMPMAGCELLGQEADITISWMGGSIPFHVYRFSRMGDEMLVAFTVWDPVLGEPLAKAEEVRTWSDYWRRQWGEVSAGREDQPAQMLTVGIPWRSGSMEFMRGVLNHLVVSTNRD
jgi:exosortase